MIVANIMLQENVEATIISIIENPKIMLICVISFLILTLGIQLTSNC